MGTDAEHTTFAVFAGDDRGGAHHGTLLGFVAAHFAAKMRQRLECAEVRFAHRRHYGAVVIAHVERAFSVAKNFTARISELHSHRGRGAAVPHAFAAYLWDVHTFAKRFVVTQAQ